MKRSAPSDVLSDGSEADSVSSERGGGGGGGGGGAKNKLVSLFVQC